MSDIPAGSLPGDRRLWASTVLAAMIAVLLCIFAVVRAYDGCGSCSSLVPSGIIAGAAAGWLAVAGLRGTRFPGLALALASLLTAVHAGIIAFAVDRACLYCLSFLALEGAEVTLLLGERCARGKGKRGPALGAVLVSMVLGAGASWLVFGVHLNAEAPRTLRAGARSAGERDRVVGYIVVMRNCDHCEKAEQLMREALEDGAVDQAVVLDARSEEGKKLSRQLSFKVFPSFAVTSDGQVRVSQEGGAIEDFLEKIRRKVEY
jgi:hypothetical protein